MASANQSAMFDITKFKPEKWIASGSSGTVYKYVKIRTLFGSRKVSEVVVKRLPIPAGENNGSFEVENSNEIQAMMNLSHDNIVSFLGYCVIDKQIAIVMELCKGDLNLLIQSPQALTVHEIAFLMEQVCQGLAYLHQNGVIHGNIKPGKILLQHQKKRRQGQASHH